MGRRLPAARRLLDVTKVTGGQPGASLAVCCDSENHTSDHCMHGAVAEKHSRMCTVATYNDQPRWTQLRLSTGQLFTHHTTAVLHYHASATLILSTNAIESLHRATQGSATSTCANSHRHRTMAVHSAGQKGCRHGFNNFCPRMSDGCCPHTTGSASKLATNKPAVSALHAGGEGGGHHTAGAAEHPLRTQTQCHVRHPLDLSGWC
jgi:hypothetical protein